MAPYVCNLSPEVQKYAKDHLNEDPARRAADIEHIRQWIKKQPHLNARTDDWFILVFLRGCKFSLEKTKKKIDAHYTIKAMLPEWFKGRDPNNKNLREILEKGSFLFLPQLDKKGRQVIINKSSLVDPRKYAINDIFMATYMLIDVAMEEGAEVGIIMGSNFIMDGKGTQAAQLLMYTPTILKKSMILGQDAYPGRPQGFHYINAANSFETVFSIMKRFLGEKLRKRLKIHSDDLSSLFEEVPQEIFPKEYGGQQDVQEIIDYWMKKLDDRRDWILEQDKYGVDESKRPGKPKTAGDLFGVDGSFRKLEVD